jgi:hypothetical protein
MFMTKLRFVVADTLSVTAAVKLKLPTADGVPLITPLLASVKPGGALPDQRYGGTPPEADKVCEYGAPRRPVASGETVVIASGAGLIAIAKLRLTERDALSVTVA